MLIILCCCSLPHCELDIMSDFQWLSWPQSQINYSSSSSSEVGRCFFVMGTHTRFSLRAVCTVCFRLNSCKSLVLATDDTASTIRRLRLWERLRRPRGASAGCCWRDCIWVKRSFSDIPVWTILMMKLIKILFHLTITWLFLLCFVYSLLIWTFFSALTAQLNCFGWHLICNCKKLQKSRLVIYGKIGCTFQVPTKIR